MNMMTEIIGRPTPPIALLRALPPGPLAKEHARLKRLADLFAGFDRDDMEAGVELLLAEMDARDGDSDLEPTGDREGPGLLGYNSPKDASQLPERRDAASAQATEDDEPGGDELDGSGAEDDFCEHSTGALRAPGCPVADPDCGVDDGMNPAAGDYTYAEWHTLSASRRRSGEIDGKPLDPWRGWLHEDVEDDNPREDDDGDNCITDGPHDEEPCGESDASWPERISSLTT